VYVRVAPKHLARELALRVGRIGLALMEALEALLGREHLRRGGCCHRSGPDHGDKDSCQYIIHLRSLSTVYAPWTLQYAHWRRSKAALWVQPDHYHRRSYRLHEPMVSRAIQLRQIQGLPIVWVNTREAGYCWTGENYGAFPQKPRGLTLAKSRGGYPITTIARLRS
jgi:hypothetical protein